tara:strand:+ start:421 stop:1131 length:711 start_codon:yes stop_codon:yes gene_type:complete
MNNILKRRRRSVGAVNLYSNTKSINFDATDDYMVSGSNVSYDEGSFITWVKHTGASNQIFWHVSGNYYLYQYTSGGLRFRHPMTGSTNVTANINDGNWHCIVGTAEGGSGSSSTIKIYVDGSLIITDTDTRTYTVTANVITLGAWLDPTRLVLNGSLDEVAFWSSVLSASEVTELYNSGTPIDLSSDTGNYSSSSNLLNWWRMGDGDTYPTIQDNQGSNDLTMTNMTSGDIVADVP